MSSTSVKSQFPRQMNVSSPVNTGSSPRTVQTDGLMRRLQQLERDLRVVIIGAGAMGKGLLYQCHVTPGFSCLGLADIDLERATACAEAMDMPYRVVET